MGRVTDTTIAISSSTRTRLRTFGKMGDTFEDVLISLMDEKEKKK
ncbi:hypothetical protein LCGC14_0372130 [marine sediment metagenome]|uniref:Uncharacterized protein n=1 Tax=marine sediment metagenome TaxID=412755 RepID=A0A0F9TMM2_9ZZZZ